MTAKGCSVFKYNFLKIFLNIKQSYTYNREL